MSKQTDTDNEPIDIERIMQEIRAEILAQRGLGAAVPTGGKRLPPEFYEHLYQATLASDQLLIQLHVTPIRLPLIGPLLERLRRMVHQLVLFYVNQLAAQQTEVNGHMLQALSILSQELERQTPANPPAPSAPQNE
jgi:hypothetical protein